MPRTSGGEKATPVLDTYTNIPDYVILHLLAQERGKLSRSAIKLYLYLRYRRNNGSESAWPGVRTIAREAHISKDDVKFARDQLESIGFISTHQGEGYRGTVLVKFNDEKIKKEHSSNRGTVSKQKPQKGRSPNRGTPSVPPIGEQGVPPIEEQGVPPMGDMTIMNTITNLTITNPTITSQEAPKGEKRSSKKSGSSRKPLADAQETNTKGVFPQWRNSEKKTKTKPKVKKKTKSVTNDKRVLGRLKSEEEMSEEGKQRYKALMDFYPFAD